MCRHIYAMDEDTTDAAWAELELQQRQRREDELIERVREQCSSFRADCDAFHAAFIKRNRNLNNDRPELTQF